MTENLLIPRQFSRRQFIGGSVAVAFSLTATSRAFGRTRADAGPAGEVDNAWIIVQAATPEGTGTQITVYCPKVELGTGTETALGQIVVEELYADMSQLVWVQGDTDFNPTSDPSSQGYTAGSQTVQVEGPTLRQAAADAFGALHTLAENYFGVRSAKGVKAAHGMFTHSRQTASYGEVIGEQTVTPASGSGTLKSYKDYTVVGTSVPRVDLRAKFLGQFTYSADVRLEGMQFARVVRPSGRNATYAGWGSAYSTALSFPGIVGIYQTGNFVYVLSSDEGTAAQVVTDFGANIAQWNDGPALTTLSSLQADPSTNPLMNTLADGGLVYVEGDQVDVGDAPGVFSSAPPNDQLTATYFSPFYMHGSMGGSAAVAEWDGSTMTVYSGTQGPGPLQAAITALLQAFDSNFAGSVHIIYTEQPGCYGHDGADDCSAEAALIAYQQGGAIKVQWSRADENQWEPLGPATAHQMQGAIGQGTISDSQVISWQHDVYSPPHNSRPGAGAASGNLLVAQYIGGTPAPMPPLNVNLATRNAPVNYAFPNSRVGRHFVTSFQLAEGTTNAASPLTWVLPRSTALRSLGGLSNSFANECFMDEMAQLAGAEDPIAWRVQYLSVPRAVAALQAVGAMPPAKLTHAASGHEVGRGVGFISYENDLTYVAVIAEVDVDTSSGQVTVLKVWVAHDCGLVINPDGLQNQIEGNVIQGISRTLIEAVEYSGDEVTQNGWYNYAPYYVIGYNVIQFTDVPTITIKLLDQPSQPAWGAGEPGILAMPGAIGNAVFNATGARVRTLPMTPAAVSAALAAL